MKPGDIVTVCGGALRGAIGTVESKDDWGYFVKLWGDNKPDPRYFDYADLEMLSPATARSQIVADLGRVNRAIQSYGIWWERGEGESPPSFTVAREGLKEERAALLVMLDELDKKAPVP